MIKTTNQWWNTHTQYLCTGWSRLLLRSETVPTGTVLVDGKLDLEDKNKSESGAGHASHLSHTHASGVQNNKHSQLPGKHAGRWLCDTELWVCLLQILERSIQ